MVPKDAINPGPQIALLEKFIQESEALGDSEGLRIGQNDGTQEEMGFHQDEEDEDHHHQAMTTDHNGFGSQQPGGQEEYNGEPYADTNQVEDGDSLAV